MRALVPSFTIRLVTCLMLAASGSVACADETQVDSYQWQSYHSQMTRDDYNESFRENRQLLGSYFKSAAKTTFSSVGIPDRAVDYMGVAIGLATRDTRLHLNESKSLTLELRDVTQGDRAIFFGFRKGW